MPREPRGEEVFDTGDCRTKSDIGQEQRVYRDSQTIKRKRTHVDCFRGVPPMYVKAK